MTCCRCGARFGEHDYKQGYGGYGEDVEVVAKVPAIAMVEIEYAEDGAEYAGYQADHASKSGDDADDGAENAGKNTDNGTKNAENYGYHQYTEEHHTQEHQDFHNQGPLKSVWPVYFFKSGSNF